MKRYFYKLSNESIQQAYEMYPRGAFEMRKSIKAVKKDIERDRKNYLIDDRTKPVIYSVEIKKESQNAKS